MDVDFSYLQGLLDSAITLARADQGVVNILAEPQGKFYVAAQSGLSAQLLATFPPGELSDPSSAASRAANTRRRVEIIDVETEDWFARYRDAARHQGFRSLAATPLISRRGRVLGVLTVLYQQPHKLSVQEGRVLDTYARMAAIVIEAGRLKGTIARHRDRDNASAVSDIELKAAIRRLWQHPQNSALIQEICSLGDRYISQLATQLEYLEPPPDPSSIAPQQ